MKEQIQRWITENKTKLALNNLIDEAEGEQREDLLLLLAQYNKMRRENRLFLASRNELSAEYNRLNQSILETAREMFAEEGDTSDRRGTTWDSKKRLQLKRGIL